MSIDILFLGVPSLFLPPCSHGQSWSYGCGSRPNLHFEKKEYVKFKKLNAVIGIFFFCQQKYYQAEYNPMLLVANIYSAQALLGTAMIGIIFGIS